MFGQLTYGSNEVVESRVVESRIIPRARSLWDNKGIIRSVCQDNILPNWLFRAVFLKLGLGLFSSIGGVFSGSIRCNTLQFRIITCKSQPH